MIDLHTHTTASDGRCTPAQLAMRASEAGVTVLAVTDHDTLAGCAEAAAACVPLHIEFVPGIEVSAVFEGVDVHVLGYFVDPDSPALGAFLAQQRASRLSRIRDMIERLASYGIELDPDEVLGAAMSDASKSAGRPWIARALVAAGHVPNVAEAFNRWLAVGRPAFVPRLGPSPESVFARIHAASGVASLAHPVLLKHDDWIPRFAAAGLDGLEAYHADHDHADTACYRALAARLGLVVTGGSDYHADEAHGGGGPGKVSLPRADYERLLGALAARRASASGSVVSS